MEANIGTIKTFNLFLIKANGVVERALKELEVMVK